MAKYRIVKIQRGPEFDPYYEIQKKILFGWICDCWSTEYEKIKSHYDKITKPIDYKEFEILDSQ